jgi:hypothetical protein
MTAKLFFAVTLVLVWGCKSPNIEATTDEVAMVVLVDMVKNAAEDKNLVRFVDITTKNVEELKKRSGTQYSIFPVSSAIETPTSIHLRHSDQQGVIIKVEVMTIQKDFCSVAGSYTRGFSFVGFRYTLRKTFDVWKIVSVKNTIAT